MAISAVLFDLDGTLVDSNEFHVRAWDFAFESFGHPIPNADIRKQIGQGADMLIPALLPQLDEDQQKAIAQCHDENFRTQYLPLVKGLPGAKAVVGRLHEEDIKIVLASSANDHDVQHYIDLLAIRPFLTAVTTADDVEHSKPAGDIFAAALQKISPLEPAATIAIGDTPYDVIAAKRCGIETIGLLSGGFSKDELVRAGAVSTFPGVQDLLNVGIQHWRERSA